MKSRLLPIAETAGLRFLLSLPPEEASPRPLLCFLHGLDEGPPTEIRTGLTRQGPLRPGSSRKATGEFIVVAPHLPERGDNWRFYADAVVEIIRQVRERYGGDPLRTYLSGFSFGGNGVFDFARMDRETWAALWPVDPTRAPAHDPGLPVWLSSGEVSRYGSRRFIERLRLLPPGSPGAGDRIYVDAGLDHVGTSRLAYADDGIYDWLLSKRRLAEKEGQGGARR